MSSPRVVAGESRYEGQIEVTEEVVGSFAAFSGDDNPLHMDAQAARRMGFGRRVAHGAILLAEVSRVIGTELPGPGSLWLSSEVEFAAPAYVGDVIDLRFRVVHVSTAVDVVLAEFEATRRSDGRQVIAGTAKIKVLRESPAMNHVPLAEQRVLVSGGTRGLGRSIVLSLLAEGADVVALYRSDDARAAELASDCDAGDRLVTVQCDVTRSEDVSRLFDTLGELRREGLHSFVHAASPPLIDVPFEDLDWATLTLFMETYVKGALDIVQRCVRHFEEAGCGRVVFIGTEATQAPRKNWTHYLTTKAALTGLVRSLAVELAHIPATANIVSPGALHTSDVLPENVKAMTRNATPLKRLVTEEEVADMVTFLLGKGGSFLSGATIPMTGGRIVFA